MKNGSKIVVAIVGLLVLSLILFLSGQRNNISAIIHTLRNSELDITKKIEEKREELSESLKEYIPVVPRDFTPEEESKIISGELDPESVVEQLFLPPDSDEISVETTPSESTGSGTESSPQSPTEVSSPPQQEQTKEEGKEISGSANVASKAISDTIAKL